LEKLRVEQATCLFRQAPSLLRLFGGKLPPKTG
jgi:hypothetical protein